MQTDFNHNVWDQEDTVADTSKETFNNIKDDLPSDREFILSCIVQKGQITLKELSCFMHRTPNDISGRITELSRDRRIIVVGKKYLPNSRGRMTANRIYEAVEI